MSDTVLWASILIIRSVGFPWYIFLKSNFINKFKNIKYWSIVLFFSILIALLFCIIFNKHLKCIIKSTLFILNIVYTT